MKSTRDEGGQAFPRPAHPGMTLRDWFAGQVVSGLITRRAAEAYQSMETNAPEVAEVAYRIADAMIAHRGSNEH